MENVEDHPNGYIGARIRELREKRRMSRKALGHSLGVKPRQVSKYEHSIGTVSSYTLYKLSHSMGLSVGEFLAEPSSKAESLPPISRDLPTDEEVLSFVKSYHALKTREQKRSMLSLVRSLAQTHLKKDAAEGWH